MKVYKDMITEVMANGRRKENRTGVDTLSTFNFNYELAWTREMSPVVPHKNHHVIEAEPGDGIPIPLLTTKRISWKNIVVEMLWFLSGSTDIKILQRHGCKFWDAWADEEGKVPSAYGSFWRQFPVHSTARDVVGGTSEFPSYGSVTTRPGYNDQLAWVLEELRRNPMSRRLVVSAWAPGNAQTSKLPPCHLLYAFNVQNVYVPAPRLIQAWEAHETPEGLKVNNQEQRLCLHMTQRSCDLALGVPYNMASYGLLLAIMSHLNGIKPGIFAHTLLDLHIYTKKLDGSMEEYNHIPGLLEQQERDCRPVPRVVIDPNIKELSDIEALMEPDVTTDQILNAFRLEGYYPHPSIKFKVAV